LGSALGENTWWKLWQRPFFVIFLTACIIPILLLCFNFCRLGIILRTLLEKTGVVNEVLLDEMGELWIAMRGKTFLN
jgi:hypothetical protein